MWHVGTRRRRNAAEHRYRPLNGSNSSVNS